MTEPYARLDELTRIRNDFHRAIMQEPARRAELSESCSLIREARDAETLRLLREGVPSAEIIAHLEQPELLDPGETGIAVPAGEAEAHFAVPEPEPEPEAELEL